MKLESQGTYHRKECAVFLRTTERFGGLSNMAGGYPLLINGIHIPTSEALYQACRFPHRPELQKIIIGQKSPMTAKMKSKPYRGDSRPDWDKVRVEVMWWCLRVKLAQHWEKFGNLLLSTGDKCIAEESYRDQFWGAKPINSETLVGSNILGQLLTQLREQLKSADPNRLRVVEPPDLSQFLLAEKPIGVVEGTIHKFNPSTVIAPSQPILYEPRLLSQLTFDFLQTL
jgi:type I restriction enzyme, S subunit